jgi:adenine-specific DNA-methyltransferase
VLGDLLSIKRGLATGANSFFLLTEDTIKEWGIPRRFLKPILPGPRHLIDDVVEPFADGAPKVSPILYLLDCSEPEDRIRAMWPRFYEYLQQGREQKVHSSYLTSRRAPWYSQEQRPPAPFLCTYMGRAGKHKDPFRFIWNRSQATAHNVYLMLYPKARLATALVQHPELEQQVFEALKRITPKQLVSEGRVYGGGLHKVEPKELAHIPARSVLDSIQHHVRIDEQLPMFA